MAEPFALIAGLGNPGTDYLMTRHNLGFLVLDAWADEENVRFREEKLALAARLETGERLIKPQTYMNESGRSVAAWLDWLKLPTSRLLIIVDDVALPLGEIRLRTDGSSGGHNGLKSVEEQLGTRAYARLRCGVNAVPPGWALERWVLSRFRAEEEEAVARMVRAARQAIECCQKEGLAAAMNRFNGKNRVDEEP